MCMSLSLLDYRTERASEKKRGMKTLLELRQRSRGYEPVNIDDDFELVPVHYPSRTTQFDRTTFEDNSNEIDDLSRGNLEQKKKKSSNFCKSLSLSLSLLFWLSFPPLRCLVSVDSLNLWSDISLNYCSHVKIKFNLYYRLKRKYK